MQAIILAAGMGKRLGELTRENTKCMVKVHEQTLIERMIGQLERLGVKRVILVIGYKGEKVRELIGNKINHTPILYITNPVYDKTNPDGIYVSRVGNISDRKCRVCSWRELYGKCFRHPVRNMESQYIYG